MTMTLGAIGGKRDVFLQRIAAMLAQRGRGHVDDDAVVDIAKYWRSPVWRTSRRLKL